MDLKGAGFSSKPKDSKYAPKDQARLILDLLKIFQLKDVVLIGHSLGGGISLLTCLQALREDYPSVKGLILIDSAGYSQRLPFFVSTYLNPCTRWIAKLMPVNSRARFVLERIRYAKDEVSEATVNRYAFFWKLDGSQFALCQTAKQILDEDPAEISPCFKELKMPTLILWGDSDPVISLENGKRFNRDIPNSKLVVFQRTGHIPHEERPHETFSAIDDFLNTIR